MWAYIHGLVGILRKVNLITEEIDDINDPMSSSKKIGENIDGFLKKFIEDII